MEPESPPPQYRNPQLAQCGLNRPSLDIDVIFFLFQFCHFAFSSLGKESCFRRERPCFYNEKGSFIREDPSTTEGRTLLDQYIALDSGYADPEDRKNDCNANHSLPELNKLPEFFEYEVQPTENPGTGLS